MITILSHLRGLLKENEKDFHSTYERFLYILGYIEGIKSQKEFDWCHMTKEDIEALIKESVTFGEKGG